MSPSVTIRTAGFLALLAVNGETLNYGGSFVQAIVNRNVKQLRDNVAMRDGEIDFGAAGLSEIELLADVITPVTAQSFLDNLGFRHRIKHVLRLDVTWLIYALPSQV